MPADVGERGAAVWSAAWRSAPWLTEQDAATLEALVRLEDEAATYRAALVEHGAILTEVMISPKGDVVGERFVANPAEAMLRRVERSVREFRAALGLTPVARARLGLVEVESQSKLEALRSRHPRAGRATP